MKRLSRETVHFWVFAVGVLSLAMCFVVQAQIPAQANQWRPMLTAFAKQEWGPNAPVSTFAAQVHQESGWRPSAKSPVGALGMAQFMPATASWIARLFPSELGSNDPGNPAWDLRAMVTYMKWLWNRAKAANACERMAFAQAGYNGGEGWVNKRKKLSTGPLVCLNATCAINPGIHPANQKENEYYPKRILLELEPRYEGAGWGLGSC